MRQLQDNFGIRADYQARKKVFDSGDASGAEFWTPARVMTSRYYQYPVYVCAREMILEHKLQSVLDLGCGSGIKLAQVIAPVCSDIVGLDQPSAIDYCRAHWDFGEFIPYNVEVDLFPLHRTFDLILCADVIEHLLDPDKLLRDVRQAAHPKSLIVLSTPERDTLHGKDAVTSKNPYHIREWSQSEFANYLSSRGLVIQKHVLIEPLKFGMTKSYWRDRLHQFIHFRSFRFCQMVVCTLA